MLTFCSRLNPKHYFKKIFVQSSLTCFIFQQIIDTTTKCHPRLYFHSIDNFNIPLMTSQLSLRYAINPKACIIKFARSCDLSEIACRQSPPLPPPKPDISSVDLKQRRDTLSRLKEIAAQAFTSPLDRFNQRLARNEQSIIKFRTRSKLKLKLKKELETTKKLAETWKSERCFLPKSIRGYRPMDRLLENDLSLSKIKVQRINGTRIEQIAKRADRYNWENVSGQEVFHTTLFRPADVKVKIRENFRSKTVENKMTKRSIDIAPWEEDDCV